MGILVIALSINPRPLSALELTLSGLIMGSRVDTAGDNQSPHVIISKYEGVYGSASLTLKSHGCEREDNACIGIRFLHPFRN